MTAPPRDANDELYNNAVFSGATGICNDVDDPDLATPIDEDCDGSEIAI